MHINVLRELRQAIGAVSILDVSEPLIAVDDLDIHDLTGTATLLRTDRGLLVTFRAKGRANVGCSRCLTEVETPIEIAFEEEYVPVIDANTGARIRKSTAPDTFRIGPDFVLELREAVRQYILMSEPSKPLCRPDCRGLCPACGADLNLGPCSCNSQADERWQALAGLRLKTDEGS